MFDLVCYLCSPMYVGEGLGLEWEILANSTFMIPISQYWKLPLSIRKIHTSRIKSSTLVQDKSTCGHVHTWCCSLHSLHRVGKYKSHITLQCRVLWLLYLPHFFTLILCSDKLLNLSSVNYTCPPCAGCVGSLGDLFTYIYSYKFDCS